MRTHSRVSNSLQKCVCVVEHKSLTRNHYPPTIPINVRFYVTEWYGLVSQLPYPKFTVTIKPHLHDLSHHVLRAPITRLSFVSGKMKFYFPKYFLRMTMNTSIFACQVRIGNALWIQKNLCTTCVYTHAFRRVGFYSNNFIHAFYALQI